jgi:DNA polymerase I-like protein with 3'-5' exonuclease and polymerase domains
MLNVEAIAKAAQAAGKVEARIAKAGQKKVLFMLSPAEQKGAGDIKRWAHQQGIDGQITYSTVPVAKIAEVVKARGYDFVAISNPQVFRSLGTYHKEGNIGDWRGSVIVHDTIPAPVLLLDTLVGQNGLAKKYTVPTFSYVLENDLGKILTYKGKYNYRFTICQTERDAGDLWHEAKDRSYIIVADIETNLDNRITSCSFTMVREDARIGHTYVLDYTRKRTFGEYIQLTRAILALLQAKCFHNGCFDNTMLMRHRIPARNYCLDTEYMWHCWEAEHEKSLAYVSSIALPDYEYWKAEARDNPLEYNAKDTINTARSLVWLMKSMPDWAWQNYAQMLPTLTPAIVCNLEGFATDGEKISTSRARAQAECDSTLAELRTILAWPEFNPGSSKQVSAVLYKVLGKTLGWNKALTGKDKRKVEAGASVNATAEQNLTKLTHPLAARIVGLILRWREQSKAISTYYDSHLMGESHRLYYTMRPDGTKTGRFSCTASSMRLVTGLGAKGQIRKSDIENYGNQIQNSPEYYKYALCADEGYSIVNVDLNKAEARCVALISGDPDFTAAVTNEFIDFYLQLADWFFGIVTVDKKHPIRQATKKINHGSSYCMSIDTFIDFVGVAKLYEYMALVQWQGPPDVRKFVHFLINLLYHAKFPYIKKWWKRTTLELINNHGLLTNIDGSVRRFYKIPSSPNGIAPHAVAHQPQRLSVMLLNRAFWKVFYYEQIPSKFEIRLKGQIHDSIVSQVVNGKEEHYAARLKHYMELPYETTLGPLVIPADVDDISKYWKLEK